jgi:hypothetical protein
MASPETKSAQALSSTQLEQVTEAIVEAFDAGELARVLKFKWGIILGNYIDLHQGFYGVVTDLIGWTERRGKTLELVMLISAERPGNAAVQHIGLALGISAADAIQKYDLTKQTPEKPALEAMVARHSRFVDYGQFLSRFRALGNRVCRIETPTMLGTGFLVGPDRVLTNFHVIESAGKSNAIAQTICRFNYRTDDHAGTAAPDGSTRKSLVGLHVINLSRRVRTAKAIPVGGGNLKRRNSIMLCFSLSTLLGSR